jgi:hypothetical protein
VSIVTDTRQLARAMRNFLPGVFSTRDLSCLNPENVAASAGGLGEVVFSVKLLHRSVRLNPVRDMGNSSDGKRERHGSRCGLVMSGPRALLRSS